RPASSDASFRRYLRLDRQGGGSAIVMDAPPALEDCRPFVHVQSLMQQAGLRVPQILAWDAAQGFMLLEDVGRETVIERLREDDPQAAHAWYLQAVERSEEHTSELQSRENLVCRLLLEKKKKSM